jgi:YD repeat-containing protein
MWGATPAVLNGCRGREPDGLSERIARKGRLLAFRSYKQDYDADGNLTRKLWVGHDDTQLGWNALGQLDTVWRHQRGTVKYGYDAQGRRVRRTAPNGSVTRYLYDGDDLLMELDGSGNPIRSYTYYPGVDRPHSVRVEATGQTYYYATDFPGHVVGLVDSANALANEYRYTPWGEIEAGTPQPQVEQPLGYVAREWDDYAGLCQVC